MNRKMLAIIILVSIIGAQTVFIFYLYRRSIYFQLENEAISLDYTNLQSDYYNLQSEYGTLQGIHNQLYVDYTNLNVDYTNLNDEYQTLFVDYDALSNVFNNPLSEIKVPTVEELEQWLSEDKVDEIQYDYPNFICGDFSVMLSQHAKLENWDMGIVAVFGYDENYESYGHAFNAIITTEGLRYVEPQNDYFWHFSDGKEILTNGWNEIGIDRENIYVEDYKRIVRFE